MRNNFKITKFKRYVSRLNLITAQSNPLYPLPLLVGRLSYRCYILVPAMTIIMDCFFYPFNWSLPG